MADPQNTNLICDSTISRLSRGQTWGRSTLSKNRHNQGNAPSSSRDSKTRYHSKKRFVDSEQEVVTVAGSCCSFVQFKVSRSRTSAYLNRFKKLSQTRSEKKYYIPLICRKKFISKMFDARIIEHFFNFATKI